MRKYAFTIEELEEIGPIRRSTIYKAIRHGKLIARKCGKRTIVLAGDWESFLENLPTSLAVGADAGREAHSQPNVPDDTHT